MNSTTGNFLKNTRTGSTPFLIRWLSVLLFMVMLVVGVGIPQKAQAISAALNTDINDAIAGGITYLLYNQQADGSFADTARPDPLGYGNHPHANTGLALLALDHHAEKLGKTPLGTYANAAKVKKAVDYLLNQSSVDANGLWVHWGDLNAGDGGHNFYETGIVLAAISRIGAPNTVWSTTATNGLANKTYKQIAQMAVDWFVSGSASVQGWGYAGWGYNKGDSGAIWDQSSTGWVVMGLGYARDSIGCTFPSDGSVQANILAISDNNQDTTSTNTVNSGYGGAGYRSPGSNPYLSGHLLYDLAIAGVAYDPNTATNRVTRTLQYFDNNWGTMGASTYNNYGAMFTVTKGFGEYEISTFGTTNHDWYTDFATAIVNTKHTDATSGGYYWLGASYVCLLYTSPSPRDGLLSRMPSSA